MPNSTFTGQCYCGETRFTASESPSVVTYCHCADCRRVTGAPVAAFAAFRTEALTFTPDARTFVTVNKGVTRGFCGTCGSPMTGEYNYLLDQTYIALGLIDQANDLPPGLHAQTHGQLRWLHINDDLDRFQNSARTRLNT